MNRSLLPLSVSLVLAAPAAIAQCVIPGTGTSQMQNGVLVDGWTLSIPLGMTFPFGAGTFTDMYISDHGMIALNNGGTPAAPPGVAFTYNVEEGNLVAAGTSILAPFYSDHSMFYNTVAGTNIGELWVDNTSGTYCTVTWTDVETYIDGQAFTFQATMYDDGRVTYKYDSRVCNEGSSFGALGLNAVIGMGEDGMTLPTGSDLSANPVAPATEIFELFTAPGPLTCNPMFDLADTMLEFIPTTPGWAVINSPLQCATQTPVGAGCFGLSLSSNLPVIGGNWELTTTGLTLFDAITFFGPSTNPAGVPFGVIGINSPGCNVYINAPVLGSLTSANMAGTALLSVPVPLNATLKGAILGAQSVSLDVGVPSLINASNAIEGGLGY